MFLRLVSDRKLATVVILQKTVLFARVAKFTVKIFTFIAHVEENLASILPTVFPVNRAVSRAVRVSPAFSGTLRSETRRLRRGLPQVNF